MSEIRVIDIVGPICIVRDDGATLAQKALPALEQESDVLLNFAEVRTLTSSFLSAFFDSLLDVFAPEAIRERLKWSGLDTTDDALMRAVFDSAIRFIAYTPEQQEAIGRIFLRAFED